MARAVLALLLCACLNACLRRRTPAPFPDDPARASATETEERDGADSTSDESALADARLAPPHVSRIPDRATWRQLAARPPDHLMPRTEIVKTVWDLETDRLYFVNSREYEIHFDFVQRFLDPTVEHETFNVEQYTRPERRYLLANLVHYRDGGFDTLELVAGDTLDGERIRALFEKLRSALDVGADLRFRPLSRLHERNVARLGDSLPRVDEEALKSAQRYRPLARGVAVGVLRLGASSGPATEGSVIRVVGESRPPRPDEVGMILSHPESSLGDEARIARERGVVLMSLRGADTNAQLRALEGVRVRLEVHGQDFVVEPAPRATPSTPTPRVHLSASRSDDDFRAPTRLCGAPATRAGALGARLARLCAMRLPVAPSVLIPTGSFARHVARLQPVTSLRESVSEGGAVDGELLDAATLSIREGAFSARWTRALARALRTLGELDSDGLELRASPNLTVPAELARERAIVVDGSIEAVTEGVRTLWARTFGALVRAGADPRALRIAILARRASSSRTRGIALSRTPFDPLRPGVFISAWRTAGAAEPAREEHLVYTWITPFEPELVERVRGPNVLSDAEVDALAHALGRAHEALISPAPEPHEVEALEVRFEVGADGLRLTDVRPTWASLPSE